MSKVGRNRKSRANAKVMVNAVIWPMSEFILKPDRVRTRNPATSATVVTHMAVPTVLKE